MVHTTDGVGINVSYVYQYQDNASPWYGRGNTERHSLREKNLSIKLLCNIKQQFTRFGDRGDMGGAKTGALKIYNLGHLGGSVG